MFSASGRKGGAHGGGGDAPTGINWGWQGHGGPSPARAGSWEGAGAWPVRGLHTLEQVHPQQQSFLISGPQTPITRHRSLQKLFVSPVMP